MQTPENNCQREDESLEAPPELVAALKRSSSAPLFIPPTVDEAVLHAARLHLCPQTKRPFRWNLLIRWGIAAAVLVALLAIAPKFLRKADSIPGSNFASGDLNHDGQIDILDAFALARELKTAAPPTPQMDINGDGVVDERDVATLAARAVCLGKGGRS